MSEELDLFGNIITNKLNLRDKYIEPPFSIFDAKTGQWQDRKRKWKSLGIKSQLGRQASVFRTDTLKTSDGISDQTISIFDPNICELIYNWFCPQNGSILDPFAGGSVRGIVANYLGYKYTGIQIREQQVLSNLQQCKDIIPNNIPEYIIGDSNVVLDELQGQYDLIFTCPPYVNLEVYSDLQGDISNIKDYDQFLKVYQEIIRKTCLKLKNGGFACFVVSQVRDKKGNYFGFVPDTINAFRKINMKYYNQVIYSQPIGSASIRADLQMSKSKKICRVHQNILIFKKD